MPSLNNYLVETIKDADGYKDAVLSATKETGLDRSVFPKELPYTKEKLLDDNFYPANH